MSDDLKVAVNDLCLNIKEYRNARKLLRICKLHNLGIEQSISELVDTSEKIVYLSIDLVNSIIEFNNL